MTKALSAALLATTLLAGCKATDLPAEPADPSENVVRMAPTPVSSPGMVAAAHPLATQAGLDILARGGSAVDAAVAVQAALGLVEPQSSGLGGGAFMVVYSSTAGEVWSYDGREEAPSDVDETLFQGPDGEPIGYLEGIVSGRSTGTPGAVVMLAAAHADYGNLDWAELFEPVIPLAEGGFPVGERLNSLLERFGKYGLADDPNAGPYFFPGGQAAPVGSTLVNQPYADTLRALQANPRALVEGPIAASIAAKVAEEPRPGTLSLADMAGYEAVRRPALCSKYREHTVCGARPPASGPLAVQMALGILENFDMRALGPTAAGWHHLIEAERLAYADRDAYAAAPDAMVVSVEALLDKGRLAKRAQLIDPTSAMDTAPADTFGNPPTDATPDSPGTSHFSVVDGDGLVVSMTTTVEGAFGSQRMVGGFLLNNQLTDFSFRSVDDQGRPIANRVGPGKRPRSSMSPSVVFRPSGEFYFTTGSPGGNSIIAYTLKTIVAIIDWGLDPQAAADLPNVVARGDRARIEEARMGEEKLSALEAMGHEVRRSEGEISGIHIILRENDGSLVGAADVRREGTAEGVR